MEFIINGFIILVGIILFVIFIRQNFTGKGQEAGSCDCSSCVLENCASRNNNTINPDK